MNADQLPNINPFTGKKFTSDEERDAFVKDQQEKRAKTATATTEYYAKVADVTEKWNKIMAGLGFSREEVQVLNKILKLPFKQG